MKKTALDRLIAQAESQANFMNFESDGYNQSFESLDSDTQTQLLEAEMLEVNNLVQQGFKIPQAQNLAKLKVNQVADSLQAGALAKVPSGNSNPFLNMPVQNQQPTVILNQPKARMKPTKATFTINIKRLTNTISANLPVVLFGKTFSLTYYVQLIQSLLPAGVTLTAVQVGGSNSDSALLTGTLGNSLKVRFHFTDNATPTPNVDIIEVTCNEVPYPTFIDATQTDSFEVKAFRYKISDASEQAQYDIAMEFKKKTMFGKGGEQTLTPSTYINTTDFKDNLVEVDQPFAIDKDSYVATSIVSASNFQVTLSFSVDAFIRNGSNLL
jgi:hypothetical protein